MFNLKGVNSYYRILVSISLIIIGFIFTYAWYNVKTGYLLFADAVFISYMSVALLGILVTFSVFGIVILNHKYGKGKMGYPNYGPFKMGVYVLGVVVISVVLLFYGLFLSRGVLFIDSSIFTNDYIRMTLLGALMLGGFSIGLLLYTIQYKLRK